MIFWIITILVLITAVQLMRAALLAKKIGNKKEEDISDEDNSMNAFLLGVFGFFMLGSVAYMGIEYGNGLLPRSASAHGDEIDSLFFINWIIVLAVFFIVNGLLFAFAIKYKGKKGNKAYYFAHDNRLEMIWTVIPASVLAVIIILGLRTWNDITGAPSENAQVIEVFGEQFKWTVRYSGEDNKLGYADYKLTTKGNPLGVISPASLDTALARMQKDVKALNNKLEASAANEAMYSKANVYKMQSKMEKLERIKTRIEKMKKHYKAEQLVVADDDFVTGVELHLVKGQEYQFIFRAKDVMHSAYFPHFRAQMNVVPGMRTKFKIKPTISTKEMRKERNDDEFNFVLLCNKICGESHSNMKLIVVVDESVEEFNAWKNENTKTAIAFK